MAQEPTTGQAQRSPEILLESRMAAKCKGESVSFESLSRFLSVQDGPCPLSTFSAKAFSEPIYVIILTTLEDNQFFFFELDGPSAHFIQ